MTLQFIFFDGEEAFKTWTSTDSLYGSRHLASKWSRTPYSYQGVSGNQLDRIDVFMLLDLLGAANPVIKSSHSSTDVCSNFFHRKNYYSFHITSLHVIYCHILLVYAENFIWPYAK